DLVAGTDATAPERLGDEVDRLGRSADEDDLARRSRSDEAPDGLARALEGARRLLGERVDAAVDVRVRLLVEARDRFYDATWLLRRRGVVEIDERPAVDAAGEDRKLRPDGRDHEAGRPDHSPPPPALRSSRSRTPRRISSRRGACRTWSVVSLANAK